MFDDTPRRPPRPRERRPTRIADEHYHLWPNHAFKCTVCKWPIDKVTYPVHPGCEEPPTR